MRWASPEGGPHNEVGPPRGWQRRGARGAAGEG
eukprot:CAMPEP_0180330750 /NCGR_PEP_ID=MMETSP0988-20121125/41510_1 /TAXON_ID=697907 /ORGANISM="non described non described, Strain CCMP2293" /LENGTH=32 /DNA_ID= /DNA_START= /DNA_END= /DNA_ORIENTATION=